MNTYWPRVVQFETRDLERALERPAKQLRLRLPLRHARQATAVVDRLAEQAAN
jgi:hypothetical protein